jgi:DNA-directed RNA polymerase I, II, and III subunit RPABC2
MADDDVFVDEEGPEEEEIPEEDEEYLEMGIAEIPIGDTDRRYDISDTAKYKIPNDQRMTRNYMTKYDRAKIIGVRAQQIAMGAIPNITLPEGHHYSPVQIARMEFEQKKTPIIIQRIFHTGKYEEWKVEELI